MVSENKTASIIACAFIYKDNKVFVAKRSPTETSFPNKFELPGGHIDFGETLQEGLIREIKEEIGIDIRVEDPFYAFTYLTKNGTNQSVEIVFFTTMIDHEQKITVIPEDHTEYRWVDEKEAEEIFEQDDQELHAIKKGFAVLKR